MQTSTRCAFDRRRGKVVTAHPPGGFKRACMVKRALVERLASSWCEMSRGGESPTHRPDVLRDVGAVFAHGVGRPRASSGLRRLLVGKQPHFAPETTLVHLGRNVSPVGI